MIYNEVDFNEIINQCQLFKIGQKIDEWKYFLRLLNDADKKHEYGLEIGCGSGVSTLGLSYFVNNLITVDIEKDIPFDRSLVDNNCLYTYVCGDSSLDTTVESVRLILDNNKFSIGFVDGNHSYFNVKKDFENYKSLFIKGSILGFHDIVDSELHREVGCNVHSFWEKT